MPGAKLVAIADLSEVIVKAQFADNVIVELDKGDTALIEAQDVPGEQMTGQVSLVSRANDPLNRTVEVWISLKNTGGRLRAGDGGLPRDLRGGFAGTVLAGADRAGSGRQRSLSAPRRLP